MFTRNAFISFFDASFHKKSAIGALYFPIIIFRYVKVIS